MKYKDILKLKVGDCIRVKTPSFTSDCLILSIDDVNEKIGVVSDSGDNTFRIGKRSYNYLGLYASPINQGDKMTKLEQDFKNLIWPWVKKEMRND